MAELAELLGVLDLTPTDVVGEVCHYRAASLGSTGGVVFGGQLLAQSLVAAARTVPDKAVLSLHMAFSRGAAPALPLDVVVEPIHLGRGFASVTVTTAQNDRPATRALVLLHEPSADLIRHADPPPPVPVAVPLPDERPPRSAGTTTQPWEICIVDDVDLADPGAVGPPDLRVWCRFPGAPDEPAISQALLAYASDAFLIGTAMRPHKGIGQSMAHTKISTTVLTQTLSFHEPFAAADWLLLDQHSDYAGRGRAHGRAAVYSQDGRMVASFSQDSMVRDFPAGMAPPPGYKADH